MEDNNIKIKSMSFDEMILAIDRLTRFKAPSVKYNRVFKEIIAKYLIEPKIGFKKYDELGEEKIFYVEKIFEKSLQILGCANFGSQFLNDAVFENETKTFVVDEDTKKLMRAKIPYDSLIALLTKGDLCSNLKFLKYLSEEKRSVHVVRQKFATKFPIAKVLLVEGITEEILLPKFAQMLRYDFDVEGVEIIAAGGKNQVAKSYMELYSLLKCPIMVLLDADGQEIADKISAKLRLQDKIVLIEKGEFEDILPKKLIKSAINFKYKNFFEIKINGLERSASMVKTLEAVYRENGLGEFKKAEFAMLAADMLAKNGASFISDEIKTIVEELKNT